MRVWGVCVLMVLLLSFQDIRPKKGGPPVGPRLIKRGDVPKVPYEGSLPIAINPCCHGH
jgi:formamidase